ncbi:MAG: 30S ribosomal protein S8e [Candidatus Hadarchaeales archaeon]
MSLWHGRSLKKPTGGRRRISRGKRRREMGRDFIPTHPGPTKRVVEKGKGGRRKIRLLSVEFANVSDSHGRTRRAKILSVLENPANRDFVRTETITKGAIILTEVGKARVTSRPGQEPVLNAVLLEEK